MGDPIAQELKQRVGCKRPHPNPLFKEWLESLFHDAVREKSHLSHSLKEAITSLSKYPLPLKSGSECGILKGFDQGLCRFIDIHLKELKQNSDRPRLFHQQDLLQEKSQLSRDLPIFAKPGCSISEVESEEETQGKEVGCHKQTHRQATKLYKPPFRSGAYAILAALMEQQNNSPIMEGLTKDELIRRAQLYCDTSFDEPLPGSEETVWTGVKRLMQKSLVRAVRTAAGDMYSLTARGAAAAAALPAPRAPAAPRHCVATDQNIIEMAPFTYDVILLIDKNETGGTRKKKDPTVALFNKYSDLKYEYRSLKVGDYAWIARCKTSGLEVVLPLVVERKRLDDLAASIKDGRFHEQKFRLRRCGLRTVVYLLERGGGARGLPAAALAQAAANCSVQDGFVTLRSASRAHSVRLLARLSRRLAAPGAALRSPPLPRYAQWAAAGAKARPLTVREWLVKMLVQLRGVSAERALAVAARYGTPRALRRALQAAPRPALLLAPLRLDAASPAVGPVLSNSIYLLFTASHL